MPLDRFPGALCDPHGYVIFDTQHAYESCRHLEIGQRVSVRRGVSKLPGYVPVE